MTRARDGDPERRRRAASHPPRRLVALAFVLSVVAGACGSTSLEPPAPGASATGGGSSGPAGASPDASSAPASAAVSGGPSPAASDTPSDAPIASEEPSSSGGPIALGCSGSENNRSFFADAAANLSWDVYCAVLPDGWFVEAGNYRLGGGGMLRIAYKGPNGGRLELREGAVCGDQGDCHPSGESLGQAAYGNRQGDLIALEGGGYELVVDADGPVSWIAISANLEEADFRDIAAALQLVRP